MLEKISYAPGLAELIVKMDVLAKVIYKFNGIFIQVLMTFYTQLKSSPKIHLDVDAVVHS